MPCSLDAAPDTVLRVARHVRGGGVLARGPGVQLVDQVASTATANVVDGGGVLPEAFLLGEFLVEAEHGALLLEVDIAGTAAARGEETVRRGRSELDAGGRARSITSVGHVLGVHAGDIASSTTAVVDVGGRDGRVRLGDVVGDHFDRNWLFGCLGGGVVVV